MTLFIVLATIATYVSVAGFVGMTFWRFTGKNCDRNETLSKRGYGHSGYCMHDGGSLLMGVVWPVSLFILAGVFGAKYTWGGPEREDRREKRAQADHAREMERLAAERKNQELTVEILKHEGVPMYEQEITYK